MLNSYKEWAYSLLVVVLLSHAPESGCISYLLLTLVLTILLSLDYQCRLFHGSIRYTVLWHDVTHVILHTGLPLWKDWVAWDEAVLDTSVCDVICTIILCHILSVYVRNCMTIDYVATVCLNVNRNGHAHCTVRGRAWSHVCTLEEHMTLSISHYSHSLVWLHHWEIYL